MRTTTLLVGQLCLGLLMTGHGFSGQGGPTSEDKESLKHALRLFAGGETEPAPRHAVVFRDLNGDGIPEAIVYLLDPGWCGSGGCNTLILTRDRGGPWRVVANETITRPPIRVLTNAASAWHSISVWRAGGGIHPGYEDELRFDGSTYRAFAPPAGQSKAKLKGEVAIPSSLAALYKLMCDDGEMWGCSSLGIVYERGEAVPKDAARAEVLYKRACNGGDMQGCSGLGSLYESGPDVHEDLAAGFYKQACDGGYMKACYDLGRLYESGRGVPKDEARALELFDEACDGGWPSGCPNVRNP